MSWLKKHVNKAASADQGYQVYSASNWRKVGNFGEWTCGNCRSTSRDSLSPHQRATLADCTNCGRTNRIKN